GVSAVKINLNAKEVHIEGSGTSAINLAGNVKTLRVKASGMSSIEAYDCKAEDVKSESSGASQLFITASRTLSVKASGTSGVKYKGNAQLISRELSAASHMRKI